MASRLARLSWEALDRAAYASTYARLWLFDLIHGPEPLALADEKREADHERLRRAFPGIDFDKMIAIAEEGPHAQTQATATIPLAASGAASPPPGSPAPPAKP